MARPRKYSDEVLLEIIRKYMKDTPYLTDLKYSDLVKYAKDKLGYESIAYQDFSRNSTVKEFVEIQKERKKMSNYIKNHKNNGTYEKYNFNVDQVVDKYINNPRQLKAVLKLFKESYDNSFEMLTEQHEAIKESANTISEQKKAIEELKEKNKQLREEKKSLNEYNSTNYNFQKLKYMYLLLNDMVTQSNFYIETEDEIMDILKNFGYKSNDILDIEAVIKEDFPLEKVTVKPNTNESKADDINNKEDDEDNSESNVVPFNATKVNLPKFMKKK